MKLRHIPTRLLCEFIRETPHGWLCVECADRGHWLIFPAAEWERVA